MREKRVMKASLLDLCSPACSTSCRILETVLSPKHFEVRTLMAPVRLTQPETTSSPSSASRGMLSPVRATVFSDVLPSMMTPSRGTFSPGRIMMMSPTATSSGATVTSPSAVSLWAVSGRMSIRWEMLSRLLPSA